jgi:hypothetical protein
MFWVFVKEVEKTKKLHFSTFNEGSYGFIKVTFHYAVDSKYLDLKT